MPSALPPIVVVFDLGALMTGRTREWEMCSRLGTCYLPQVVYEEIEELSRRAEEGTQLEVAREFVRFWPYSGWLLSDAAASHRLLQPAAGAQVSKQARLVVAVAQCAYALSQERARELVVFVSDSLRLLQRMQSLEVGNLCCINSTVLMQWARSGQRPLLVTKQVQAMIKARPKTQGGAAGNSPPRTQPRSSMPVSVSQPVTQPRSSMGMSVSPPATFNKEEALASRVRFTRQAIKASKLGSPQDKEGVRDKSGSVYLPSVQRRRSAVSHKKPGFFAWLMNLLYTLVAVAGFAMAGGFAWKLVQPASFDKFWKQQVVPVWQQKVVPAFSAQPRQPRHKPHKK
ncbi:PIN domain-containing protein [Kamptonema formosum]|uniref:PIN domain-containing protein n=1 Tax=Kamptonema formosum TaxID=331992 RepID=UPI0012DCC25E|nr:PIN domain-containing protein [Oscillatoria sp. PCC 10802]